MRSPCGYGKIAPELIAISGGFYWPEATFHLQLGKTPRRGFLATWEWLFHGASAVLPRQGHAAGNPRPACPGVWAPASGLQAGGQQHLREGGNVLSPQWLVGTEACQYDSLAVRCLVDVSRQSLEGTDHHRRRIGRESDVSGAGGAGVARVKHGDFPLKSVRRSALPAVIREQPRYPWLLATTQPISNIRAGNYPAALGPG